MGDRADMRLAGCLLDAVFSSLPGDDPRHIVRVHRELLERLVRALQAALVPGVVG